MKANQEKQASLDHRKKGGNTRFIDMWKMGLKEENARDRERWGAGCW